MRFNNTKCRGLQSALLTLALMAASASAMADQFLPGPGGADVWTVYAFGNAQAVADAFRALNNFSASSTFQSIVGFIAILGVLGVGVSSGFSSAVARKFIGYAVTVFLVCYIFFGIGTGGPVVVRVDVQDTVDGTWTAPVTVPMVVGIPASVISTAGFEITKQIEASFMIPDELKMSSGAPFNLAAALISDASKARITDSNLASSLAYYVQDCFTIGVARGSLSATTLLNSTDFINDIRVDMPGVYVNTLLQAPVGVPNVVNCPTAWSLINTAVNAQGGDASSFLKNASAWAKTPAMSVVNSAADSVAQWATNNGVTDGGALIKQSAVLAAFNGAFRQTAAATGNSDFLTGLALTQAHEAQVSGWITGAEVFNRIMGYVFAVLQVFVYALTPLVLAAALVPGLGLALLKNFGQILLWLAIWQPMLAIINFVIISMQQADLGGALNSGMGAYGFTLNNMGLITEKTANMRAAATFVGTMVPALAWALVKGSVDFSRVIGSAVGEQFAQSAANTISTGNYSLNQASMDSFTANKHSVGHTGDWGFGNVSTGQGGMMQKHELGGMGGVASGDQAARLQVASTLGANSGGQVVANASDLSGGSSTRTGGVTGNLSTTGNLSEFGGRQRTSGDGTSLNGQIGVNPAQLLGPATTPQGRLAPPGSAAAARGGLPGMPGAGADAAPIIKQDNPMVAAGKAALRTLNPGAHAQKTYNTNNVANSGEMAQLATAASRGRTGSDTAAATDSANAGDSASVSMGYQKGLTQQVTGISSLSERVEAVRPALQFESDLYADYYGAKGSADYEYARGTGRDGASGQATEVAKPNVVQKTVDGVQNDVESEKARLEAEAAARHKKGDAEADKGLASPDGVINKVAGALPGLVRDSRTPASTRAIRDGVELVDKGIEAGKDLLHKGGQAVDALKQKMGGAPTPGAAVAPKPATPAKPSAAPHAGSDHTLPMTFSAKPAAKPTAPAAKPAAPGAAIAAHAQPTGSTKPAAVPAASAAPKGHEPGGAAPKGHEPGSVDSAPPKRMVGGGPGSVAGGLRHMPSGVTHGHKVHDIGDYAAEPAANSATPTHSGKHEQPKPVGQAHPEKPASHAPAAIPGAGRDSGATPAAANDRAQPQAQSVAPEGGRDTGAAPQARQPEPQGTSQGQQPQPGNVNAERQQPAQQQPAQQQPAQQQPAQQPQPASGRDGQEQRAAQPQTVAAEGGRDTGAAPQARQPEPQGTSQGQQPQAGNVNAERQQPAQQQPAQQPQPASGRDGQEQRAAQPQTVAAEGGRDTSAAPQARQPGPQGTSLGQQPQAGNVNAERQQPAQQQPTSGRDGQEQRAAQPQAVAAEGGRDTGAAPQARQPEPQGTSQGQQLQTGNVNAERQQPAQQQPTSGRDGQEQRAAQPQAVTPVPVANGIGTQQGRQAEVPANQPGQPQPGARDGQEPRVGQAQSVATEGGRDTGAAPQNRQPETQSASQGQSAQAQPAGRDSQEPRAGQLQGMAQAPVADANGTPQGRQPEQQGANASQQPQAGNVNAERQLQAQAQKPNSQQSGKPTASDSGAQANPAEPQQAVVQVPQQPAAQAQVEPQKREPGSVAALGESSDPRSGNQPRNENTPQGKSPDQANPSQDQAQRPAQENQPAANQAQQAMMQQPQQLPQPPQPPVPPAPLIPEPQQPTAPQQAPATPSQDMLPDPFSGKQNQDGAATQAQVQLAEQRSERLTNQIRSADNLLSGAENQTPAELRETVREAQNQLKRS